MDVDLLGNSFLYSQQLQLVILDPKTNKLKKYKTDATFVQQINEVK